VFKAIYGTVHFGKGCTCFPCCLCCLPVKLPTAGRLSLRDTSLSCYALSRHASLPWPVPGRRVSIE
ncbi:hypothetical protein EAM_P230, partial (plasmid) [Erwinia amylovora ATCC 49946]